MKRLNYIDGFKGWCAASVCILHFLLMFEIGGFIGWKCMPEAALNPFGYYFEWFPYSVLTNNSFPLYIFFALISFIVSYTRWGAIWSGGNSALIQGILRSEWGCDGWIITDNVATDLITVADGLRGGMTAFDASLTLLLDFEQYENDPYIRTLMREACHRGLYALINSAAMNGIGPNTEISKIIFWPVKLSFVLAIIFWGLAAFCAVRWHLRRKAWKAKKAKRRYE